MSKKVNVEIVETRVQTLCVLADDSADEKNVHLMVQAMCDAGLIDSIGTDYSELCMNIDKADDDDEVDLDLARFKKLEEDAMEGVGVYVDSEGVYHVKTNSVEFETTDVDSSKEFDHAAVVRDIVKAYYGDDITGNIEYLDFISIGLLICDNLTITRDGENGFSDFIEYINKNGIYVTVNDDSYDVHFGGNNIEVTDAKFKESYMDYNAVIKSIIEYAEIENEEDFDIFELDDAISDNMHVKWNQSGYKTEEFL